MITDGRMMIADVDGNTYHMAVEQFLDKVPWSLLTTEAMAFFAKKDSKRTGHGWEDVK